MFFEIPVLIPLVLYLIRSVSAEVFLNCIYIIYYIINLFKVDQLHIYTNYLCDKARKKIQALARNLMNAYFMSQFAYCPLVWMNQSRTLNNRINGLYKRALSLVCNDFSSSFLEILEKDKSVTIHHRSLQTLVYEIFKVKSNMAPEILTKIFPQKESNCSRRKSTVLQGRNIKTVMYGSENIYSLGLKIWDILPTELNNMCLLHYSKRKFVNGPHKFAHVVYVKRTHKTLDFCKLPVINNRML